MSCASARPTYYRLHHLPICRTTERKKNGLFFSLFLTPLLSCTSGQKCKKIVRPASTLPPPLPSPSVCAVRGLRCSRAKRQRQNKTTAAEHIHSASSPTNSTSCRISSRSRLANSPSHEPKTGAVRTRCMKTRRGYASATCRRLDHPEQVGYLEVMRIADRNDDGKK
ncbi:hypothetical protein GGS23DRAFT_340115 [Durotheca rogersii]|uniref:uncharacterized protein n=1 Tax=Durotheca rogersii TaxID=419775 RepID=UPI00221EE9E6|nr:uncharacterized protein GGS23DRAFT_340115 [Durotheca rogersii]KAI5858229.1 hypothetical protein GGS23DRAFT_340115 [Durotheca rogersii]